MGWGGLRCSEMRCDVVRCEVWCQCIEADSIHRCSVHGLYTVEIHNFLESSLLAPLPPDSYIYHAW